MSGDFAPTYAHEFEGVDFAGMLLCAWCGRDEADAVHHGVDDVEAEPTEEATRD